MRRGLAIACALAAAACGGADLRSPTAPDLEPAVYTTFHPTTWMAERIAGGLVPVICLLPAGEDPIFWRPDRATLERYQRARLVVVNGAGLEQWIETASLPLSRVVDSAKGFEDRWLTYAQATTHSHGMSGAHTHTGLDGHTWMDPVQAEAQARAILDGMARAFPEHADAFRANYRAVADELAELDAGFAALAPKLRAANVIASHPAYDYLARRYGFLVTTVPLDPDGPPDVAALAAACRPGATNLLLWESEPSPATAVALPAGVVSVVVSPAENLVGEGGEGGEGGEDFAAVMHANLARLAGALGG